MLRCDQDCSLCVRHPRPRVHDFDLIERILAGESSMFEVLLHRYGARLYRAAVAILDDEAEADDAVQQACIKAYLHLDQFQRRSSFATWLTAITINEARARLRSLRANLVDQLDDDEAAQMRSPATDPEEDCLTAELADRLQAGVEALPPAYRAVFELRKNEGLSTREVSRHLGLACDVVKTRLYRARQTLRASLGARN